MIAANELRIGNWVLDGKRGITKVISVQHLTVGFLCEGASCHSIYKIIEPIPLTPEILVGCGFVYVENIARFANGSDDLSYWKIEMPNTGNSMEIFLDYSCSYFQGDAITSLHQLQNLYFALTGEELIVKL